MPDRPDCWTPGASCATIGAVALPTPRPQPDPLGEALHALRLDGVFYCRSELTAPWGLALPALPGHVAFHVVLEGSARLDVEGAAPVDLAPGALALVPHGEGHRLASGADAPTPSIHDLPHAYEGDRYAILRHGGGGARSTLVCGVVAIDQPSAHRLLELLPRTLHVAPGAAPGAAWMRATLDLMAEEARGERAGGEAMVTRLADILVVQALRAWLEHDPAARDGWLGALRDPSIGPALALIHRAPERDWTVASLAAACAMSRSAFAARFTELVGEPALRYLVRHRMHVALAALRGGEPASVVAGRVGYRSEAAFRRAFARVVGEPPGAASRRAAGT